MFRTLLAVLLLFLGSPFAASAQNSAGGGDGNGDLQTILQAHQSLIAKPSRSTVGPALDALKTSGLPGVPAFLEDWQAKNVWFDDTGLFYVVRNKQVTDVTTREPLGLDLAALSQVKPNGGVRKAIAEALVDFQLSDPDIARRRDALNAIARNLDPSQAGPLAASIDGEPDAGLKLRKERLLNYLTARYGQSEKDRVAAVRDLAGDLSVDGRAVLSQILATKARIAQTIPEDANLARVLKPGTDLAPEAAYAMIAEEADLPPILTPAALKTALETQVQDGRIADVSINALDTAEIREATYDRLAAAGQLPPRATPGDIAATLAAYTIFETYNEPSADITDAARATQEAVNSRVGASQAADLALDAISLASIYFLAAIGLAITFGVMGVINMAHGEFIMMGAYTGYVVQQVVPNYTVSLIVALPLAFAVTFAAGVAMERLVIRHLYTRPLETLLATFGISIALQQLAKNIFGTQARPLTSPGWLDGAWQINEVIAISYIRIAIFVLALLFLALLLFILKRTRLGLEVRAVTQNPRMAASMGINPDKIKMMTFGLGSGIAGIAGVAIGLYAKVTSEMGADYIVQSFMTVVVGGVGNVWGTLAGATMIGTLQKGIEWLNPSNTLAAQTYMILFIILFIQFRPKGIVALKGRAAGD
ncbi:urea ABC transporter permease subunit UrtB [Sagittula salina]|uniref:Urea ABC transporter permease subunit UrtB n=1 Tax=Sagittula salina TaxID=2820268 RepID=A0A940MR32_9RHOB|nr:urea ABC transporter permease subunit UrtB [Sagittula salina]MBP0482502.1 urea ABC transporter permease subunit UrtB [Sagittula salina]